MALLGYALHPGGEIFQARGYGDAGISTGPLTPVVGWGSEVSVLTMPAMLGRVLLFTSPLVGSVGYTPLTEQSDRLTPAGVVAREILDYPSYVKFFKPLFYLLKHEGKRAVTSLDVELVLGWGVGRRVAVIAAHDSQRGERYLKRAMKILEGGGELPWSGELSVPKPISRPAEGLRLALLDLGRNLSLERTLSSLGQLDIYPPSAIPPLQYDILVISSGPGEPVDGRVEGYVRAALDKWLGSRPVVAVGHGALALFRCIGVGLEWKEERGVVEILRPSGGGFRGETVILHSFRPLPDGWEVVLQGEGVGGREDIAWVSEEERVGCLITEDTGEGILPILEALEVLR